MEGRSPICPNSMKRSLSEAPVLMLSNASKLFHVVCDASNYAIGCALMQFDDKGREHVVSFQPRQLKPAERNYTVHDKNFGYYLCGNQVQSIFSRRENALSVYRSCITSYRRQKFSLVPAYGSLVVILLRVQLRGVLQSRQE